MTTYSKATIQALQSAVNAAGYTPALVVDGVVGPKTTAGVAWLQQTSSYSVTNGTIDNQFLANLGIDPQAATPGYAGTAQTTVQNVGKLTGGGQPVSGGTPPAPGYVWNGSNWVPPAGANVPQPVYQPPSSTPTKPSGGGGGLLNVKPPLPSGPTPKPSPPVAAKVSPIPAAVGAGAGAGLGWFAVGGPLAALIGGAVGGIGGYLFGKKSASPAMGCEMGAETDTPSTRYFTASCTALAHSPANYYRYAPKAVVDTMASYAAACMRPGVAMVPAVRRFGKWEGRRAGQSITLYGPPYNQARMGCEQ